MSNCSVIDCNGIHYGKSHCRNGHEYDEANTYIDKKNNRRQCRACSAKRDKKRYEANGKRSRSTLKGLVHGTANGYSNYNCRCDACKKAKYEWRQERLRIRPELRESARLYSKRWYYNNPDKVRALKIKSYERLKPIKRNRQLMDNYGMTTEDYNILLESQNNSCASCLTLWEEGTKYFAVDHCHITGKVRGILCHKCNMALGLLNESEQSIMQLLNYLKKEVRSQ